MDLDGTPVGRKFSKQFAMNKTAQSVNGGISASIEGENDSTGSSESGSSISSEGNGGAYAIE